MKNIFLKFIKNKKVVLTILVCIIIFTLGCKVNKKIVENKKINTTSTISLKKDVNKDKSETVKKDEKNKSQKNEIKELNKNEIQNKNTQESSNKVTKVDKTSSKAVKPKVATTSSKSVQKVPKATTTSAKSVLKAPKSTTISPNNIHRTSNVTRTASKTVHRTSNVHRPKATSSSGYSTIPNIKTSPGNSEQVIVVLANSYGTEYANYYAYEKVNGRWKEFSKGPAVIGRAGFKNNRREGDMSTPVGKYGFPFMFGRNSNPGVRFPYKKVRKYDYWVSNNRKLSEYNVWMHYEGSNPKSRLRDYEKLWEQPLYNYAAVIDYNYYGKTMGRGSGIFLHISPYSGRGTAGCVGLHQGNLLKVLRWMNPSKRPVIIMGVRGRI